MSKQNPNRYEASASLTAMLKSRVSVADVLTALGLDTDLGDLCPHDRCGEPALKATKDGNGWRCESCGETGDIFTLVMEKMDMNFPRARTWIEANVAPKRKDARTGDLFGAAGMGRKR